MPAGQSNVAFVYSLTADYTQLGFMKQASFPTTTSLVFEFPLSWSQPFLDSMARRGGSMPYRRWSLIAFDAALREILRYNWRETTVMRIRFPMLSNQSTTRLLQCTIECAVAGVTPGDPNARSASAGSGAPAPVLTRKDETMFAIQWKIDGLPGAEYSVSKVAAFDLRGGVSDLVLTSTPEKLADPFRGWLASGNTPRSGTLNCLDPSLRTFLSLKFTNLRVRSVTPAFTTDSPGPATIHLSYSSISF